MGGDEALGLRRWYERYGRKRLVIVLRTSMTSGIPLAFC